MVLYKLISTLVECFDGEHVIHATPPKIKRKSPVGCGDAFIAGFIGSYIYGKQLSDCISIAVACGAANAASVDPGDINRKKQREFLKMVKITKRKS